MYLPNCIELISKLKQDKDNSFLESLIQIILKNQDIKIRETNIEQNWLPFNDESFYLKGIRVKEIDGCNEFDILLKFPVCNEHSLQIASDFINIINMQKAQDRNEDFLYHPHLKSIIINIVEDESENNKFFTFLSAFSKPNNIECNSEVFLYQINLSYKFNVKEELVGGNKMCFELIKLFKHEQIKKEYNLNKTKKENIREMKV